MFLGTFVKELVMWTMVIIIDYLEFCFLIMLFLMELTQGIGTMGKVSQTAGIKVCYPNNYR